MSETPIAGDDSSLATEIPVNDQEQKQPVTLGFQLLLSLANVAVWLAIIPLQQLLLPLQISVIDPANKVSGLSLILFATGITGTIAPPLVGAWSDRTTSRFGRRRTWIIVGMVLTILTFILMANANSIAALAIEAALYGFVMGMILSAILAIIPDRVPVSQRATVSAFAGLAQPLGIVIGTILIAQVIKSIQGSYYAIAGILLVVLTIFVLAVHENPLLKEQVPPFSFRDFTFNFFSPLKSRDFAFTWVSRFLVILAQTTLAEFMLFYLKDVIHYEQIFPGQAADQGFAIFQVIQTVCVIVSTVISGIISDKLQRRKPFIIAASLIMTVALFLIAFVPSWPIVLVTAVIFGIGLGIFLSADIALSTQVLPRAQNRGKDLGLITSANVLPELFFPVISFVAFGIFHGYSALFSIAAIATFVAALFILPIKSVR